MSLRGEFVHLVETERLPLATLCQRFGISRKTGYKWLAGTATRNSRSYTELKCASHLLWVL